MDQIVGILLHVVIEVITKGAGRTILKVVGWSNPSERAIDVAGTAFWLIVVIAVFFGVRAIIAL